MNLFLFLTFQTGKKEMLRSWLVKTVHTKEDKKIDLAREQEELEKDLLE